MSKIREKNVEIKVCQDNIKPESIIAVQHLANIEQQIIASLLQSKESFNIISKQLKETDLTFKTHKVIFSEILELRKTIDNFDNETSEQAIINSLLTIHKLDSISTIKIINSTPSENIDLDLAELLHYSQYKANAKRHQSKENEEIHINIEDQYVTTHAIYVEGRLCEVYTTNIFKLPSEICDTFHHTMDRLADYGQKPK